MCFIKRFSILVVILLYGYTPSFALRIEESSSFTDDKSISWAKSFPYVGYMAVTFKDGRAAEGTCILLNSSHILTSAHLTWKGRTEVDQIYIDFNSEAGAEKGWNRELFKNFSITPGVNLFRHTDARLGPRDVVSGPDIAVVKLGDPLIGVSPAPLCESNPSGIRQGYIVGYGKTDRSAPKHRRMAITNLDEYDGGSKLISHLMGGLSYVKHDYQGHLDHGDSGGAILATRLVSRSPKKVTVKEVFGIYRGYADVFCQRQDLWIPIIPYIGWIRETSSVDG